MPKETEKGKKVTGTNKRGEAECAREGITQLHMNVVPRSTGNTNSGTRELTLKCKL